MNATNLLTWYEVDLTDSVLVGELTVDRESLRRVLINNPGALRYVLDSLQSPFNADTERDRATAECCTALVV